MILIIYINIYNSYSFHSNENILTDKVRRRKWTRIKMPKPAYINNMLSYITAFGGNQQKQKNYIQFRIIDPLIRTNWSNKIPLNDVVTNSILSLKHLSCNKINFDIAICFELHRLYNGIKIIKFMPKYVGINLTSKINNIKIKPYYDYLITNFDKHRKRNKFIKNTKQLVMCIIFMLYMYIF